MAAQAHFQSVEAVARYTKANRELLGFAQRKCYYRIDFAVFRHKVLKTGRVQINLLLPFLCALVCLALCSGVLISEFFDLVYFLRQSLRKETFKNLFCMGNTS